jgi:hypothetical protein
MRWCTSRSRIEFKRWRVVAQKGRLWVNRAVLGAALLGIPLATPESDDKS